MINKYLLTTLALISIGAFPSPGHAYQPAGLDHLSSPQGSPGDMLELSLSSLKESYQNVKHKNDSLLSEISLSQMNIRYLHNELKSLEARRQALSGRSAGEGSAESGVRGQWEEKIERLRQDVSRLQERIHSQSPAVRQMTRQKEKDALLSSVWKSRRDLRKAQERLERMERESARSSETIAHLKQRQAALKHSWTEEKGDEIRQKLAVLGEDNVRLKKEKASLEQALLKRAGPPTGRHE